MDISPKHKIQGRRLIFAGVLLFLIGLFTGFAVPAMTNPRMGLSSHMEGVLNGMFLIGMGLIWPRLNLSDKLLSTAYWLLLYGTFINWATILFSAITGAGLMLPIANAGGHGADWQEIIIQFGLYSLSIAMVVGCILVLVGLKRGKVD